MSRRRRQKGRNLNGILVLDKPQGLTSNGCLQEVKRLFEANKAGHTGSLDPLATGVLPVCFGEATKISQFLLNSDKRYRTKIKLGIRTDTGDSQGKLISQSDNSQISKKEVERALKQFEGDIEQIPPMYSALKHNGQPLYKLARQGKQIERKARPVSIYNIELLGLDGTELELDISCSKGTYIRTIADDLGEALGCGAHVFELRRLQAGVFVEQDSVSMEELKQMKLENGFEELDKKLIAIDRAVPELPEVRLPVVTAKYLQQGQAVVVSHLPTQGLVRLYSEQEFIGIGTILEDGRVAPRRLIVNCA